MFIFKFKFKGDEIMGGSALTSTALKLFCDLYQLQLQSQPAWMSYVPSQQVLCDHWRIFHKNLFKNSARTQLQNYAKNRRQRHFE